MFTLSLIYKLLPRVFAVRPLLARLGQASELRHGAGEGGLQQSYTSSGT